MGRGYAAVKSDGVKRVSLIINASCKDGEDRTAWFFFDKMLIDGPKPDLVTYSTKIDGFFLQNKVHEAEAVIKLRDDNGLSFDVIGYSAVINGYCKCGGLIGLLRCWRK